MVLVWTVSALFAGGCGERAPVEPSVAPAEPSVAPQVPSQKHPRIDVRIISDGVTLAAGGTVTLGVLFSIRFRGSS